MTSCVRWPHPVGFFLLRVLSILPCSCSLWHFKGVDEKLSFSHSPVGDIKLWFMQTLQWACGFPSQRRTNALINMGKRDMGENLVISCFASLLHSLSLFFPRDYFLPFYVIFERQQASRLYSFYEGERMRGRASRRRWEGRYVDPVWKKTVMEVTDLWPCQVVPMGEEIPLLAYLYSHSPPNPLWTWTSGSASDRG